jgi:hypothetical protein
MNLWQELMFYRKLNSLTGGFNVNFIFKNWKTSATPLATVIVSLVVDLGFDLTPELKTNLIAAIIAVGWVLHGFLTKDGDKTSEQIGLK